MDNANNDYARVAEQLAGFGRGGDTMLMHVNPIEVDALNRAMPGRMTKNPVTGQPEGFAFLAPLLIGALIGGVSGGVSAKSRGIPLWKGILMGAGLGAVTSGVTAGAGALLAPAAGAAGGVGGGVGGGVAGGVGGGVASQAPAVIAPTITSQLPAATLTTAASQLPTGAAALGPATLGPSIGNQLAQLGMSEGSKALGQASLGSLTPSLSTGVSSSPASSLFEMVRNAGTSIPESGLGLTDSGLGISQLNPTSATTSVMDPMTRLSTVASTSTPAAEQGLGATVDKSFLSKMIDNQFTNPTEYTNAAGDVVESTVGGDAVRSYLGNPIHAGAALMAPQLLLPYGEEEEEEHDWGIPGWVGRSERRARPADWGSSQFDYYGD